MSRLEGAAVIGQSGGPTAVINQSLVGVVEGCLARDEVTAIYGARNGVRGILEERFVDLGREDAELLRRIAATPAAALGSVRHKPTEEDCERMLHVFRAHGVRYFFYVGGNDSAETAHLLNVAAVREGYDLRLFHVPKTIDNDLACCDHTPGYGSAARFVALALMGDDADNRSLGGVKIDVIMGRHAGWLTAASRLARRDPGDGPHLIYLPERDFSREAFCASVARTIEEHGRAVVAVSEGVHDADGNLIARSKEVDSHGNVQLSGSGALGDLLAAWVREDVASAQRVRADTFGYLQRSFAGCVSPQDALEAREVGRVAVEAAASGELPHGSLAIQREDAHGEYGARYEVVPLADVAGRTRHVPEELLEGDDDVADAFVDYAAPLVGELPEVARLDAPGVPPRL